MKNINLAVCNGGLVLKVFWPDNKRRIIAERGIVQGFSSAAMKRMRLWLLTKWVEPPYEPYSITLTLSESLDAFDWRSLHKRFGRWCDKNGLPVVWRIELQRRAVPHLHLLAWLLPDQPDRIKAEWMSLTADKAASFEYGYHCRPGTSPAWMSYISLHHSKAKQSGLYSEWQGRHWGVWCRRMFADYPASKHELSIRQAQILTRYVRRYLRARGSKYKPDALSGYQILGLSGIQLERLMQKIKGES